MFNLFENIISSNRKVIIFFFLIYFSSLAIYFYKHNIPFQFDSKMLVLILVFFIMLLFLCWLELLFFFCIEKIFVLIKKDDKENEISKNFAYNIFTLTIPLIFISFLYNNMNLIIRFDRIRLIHNDL